MAAYLDQIIPDLRNALDKKFQKGAYCCLPYLLVLYPSASN